MHSHHYTPRTLLTTQLCDDRTCSPQIARANSQKLSRWRKCTWIFELIFLNRKWIRNEDLISVLKRTESVQLWLKMLPTPKSGPSRHSLAATTSYIEILIILLRLHWEIPEKSTFLPAVQVRLWTGLSPLPMSNPSLHWYLIVVPGIRYLWSKPTSAPTRPK